MVYTSDDIQTLDLNSPQNAGAYRAVRIYGPTDINAKQNLFAAIANARSNPNDGIIDSGLSAHPSSALGIAAISDTRTGANYILIRPTLIGDINLDGAVSIGDFIDLASNFGHSGPDITWQEGDLNYDNAVTIADFIDLAANFGNSYAGNVIPISDADMAILNTFAAAHGVTPVPEPATFALLIAGIVLATNRRSRSRLTNILSCSTSRTSSCGFALDNSQRFDRSSGSAKSLRKSQNLNPHNLV